MKAKGSTNSVSSTLVIVGSPALAAGAADAGFNPNPNPNPSPNPNPNPNPNPSPNQELLSEDGDAIDDTQRMLKQLPG